MQRVVWILLLVGALCGMQTVIHCETKGEGKGMTVKGQDISDSEFEDVKMTGTRFENINLSRARFHNINFSDVEFTAAQIGGTLFKHIGPPPDQQGKQARQRPVTFEESMLCDSTFRKVDLSNVKFVDCDLKGATIDGVLITDLLKAYKKKKS